MKLKSSLTNAAPIQCDNLMRFRVSFRVDVNQPNGFFRFVPALNSLKVSGNTNFRLHCDFTKSENAQAG